MVSQSCPSHWGAIQLGCSRECPAGPAAANSDSHLVANIHCACRIVEVESELQPENRTHQPKVGKWTGHTFHRQGQATSLPTPNRAKKLPTAQDGHPLHLLEKLSSPANSCIARAHLRAREADHSDRHEALQVRPNFRFRRPPSQVNNLSVTSCDTSDGHDCLYALRTQN
ncbi:hypothetical protein E4U54_000585 [Claviceps lovelessii]|nr:hypothetical protein E4U54_000585 [Claviceps lovelessii]